MNAARPANGHDVIILGAGAAGLMCAGVAARRGRSVLLLEQARHPGEKIRISGGGRCNFTNVHCRPENFLSRNPHFCRSALARFTPQHFVVMVWGQNVDNCTFTNNRISDTFADGIKLANGTRNSVVEQSTLRNTGDDAIGTWSFAADGPLPCENDTFRFNTVQTVWRASCLASYGGKDIHFEDNICVDTSNYPGVLVSTSAAPLPFSGTLTVERNTLVRAGGPHYGQEIGALRIFADQLPISGVHVGTMLIDEPTFSGIQFAGSQPSTAIALQAIEVRNAGTVGISITVEAQGAARADDVVVEGLAPDLGLRNDAAAAFSLQRGTGNSGW